LSASSELHLNIIASRGTCSLASETFVIITLLVNIVANLVTMAAAEPTSALEMAMAEAEPETPTSHPRGRSRELAEATARENIDKPPLLEETLLLIKAYWDIYEEHHTRGQPLQPRHI